ncbi:MAG: MerR family DNA-binding transcriptional regulator [Chloroflexia bacterium]|nr:MerR family DNA-binding transcriptional regulator [Chloroflexia bacterium]
MPTDERDNIRDYLGVKEAAELVGVSPATVRNWERAGKITARRNPMNGYRLFQRSDLEQLLEDIRRSGNQEHR